MEDPEKTEETNNPVTEPDDVFSSRDSEIHDEKTMFARQETPLTKS